MYNEINFNSESLKRAFERCAAMRPLVRLGEFSDDALASYEVLRSDTRTWCIVEFIRSPRGHALGKCDCPAGEKGWYCYHLAAALTVHIGLVRHGLRKSISRSIWTQISDEFWQEGLAEIDEGAEFSAPSELLRLFNPRSFFLLADFYDKINDRSF